MSHWMVEPRWDLERLQETTPSQAHAIIDRLCRQSSQNRRDALTVLQSIEDERLACQLIMGSEQLKRSNALTPSIEKVPPEFRIQPDYGQVIEMPGTINGLDSRRREALETARMALVSSRTQEPTPPSDNEITRDIIEVARTPVLVEETMELEPPLESMVTQRIPQSMLPPLRQNPRKRTRSALQRRLEDSISNQKSSMELSQEIPVCVVPSLRKKSHSVEQIAPRHHPAPEIKLENEDNRSQGQYPLSSSLPSTKPPRTATPTQVLPEDVRQPNATSTSTASSPLCYSDKIHFCVCVNCDGVYTRECNPEGSCNSHHGRLTIDYASNAWRDWPPSDLDNLRSLTNSSDPTNNAKIMRLRPRGYKWTCCGTDGTHTSCPRGRHY